MFIAQVCYYEPKLWDGLFSFPNSSAMLSRKGQLLLGQALGDLPFD